MTTDLNLNIFKANDIRGEYPSEINEKIISEIVAELINFFDSGKIVIAYDIRSSSPSLYKAATSQFKIKNSCLTGRQAKFKIVEVGLSTTPMFYFMVKKLKASGGIMVTASHNPPDYNGLKVVDKNALPVSGLRIRKLFKP